MRAFADTNIAVYAIDNRDERKRDIARRLLQGHPRPVTSPQVLREFYSAAVQKLSIEPAVAAQAVRTLRPTVAIVEDADLVEAAVIASQRWQISFWDALIVEAARRAGADTLLSEDLQAQMNFDGVVVHNPFA